MEAIIQKIQTIMAVDRDRLLPPSHIINAADVSENGNIQNCAEEENDVEIRPGCCSCCRKKSPLQLPVGEGQEFHAYKRRWYVLVLFSLMAFAQAWGWNTFGPIAASAKYAFGWSNGNIGVLASWGPTMFMLSVLPFSYLMQHGGLRLACLLTSFCLLAGGGIRCITVTPPMVTYLMNVGQVGYGLAGPVSMAGASVISATWFPPTQRFTATALMSRIMAIGGTATFIWGPRLVRDPTGLNDTSTNHTIEAEDIAKDIHIYMFMELGVAAAIFLAILCYFPSKPPTPPSLSTASIEGVDFKTGLRQIMRHRQFWLLGIPYALLDGVYIAWSANLDIVLQALNISEITVGWLAVVGNLVGSCVALILARLIDRIARYTKPVLLFLYIGASTGSLMFALLCFFYDKDDPQKYMIYLLFTSRIISASCIISLQPIVFEILCETTYPIPATVNNGVLTLVKNFFVLLFLVVLMIPRVGTGWMNWFMVGSATICIPMVVIFKGQNNRLNMDRQS